MEITNEYLNSEREKLWQKIKEIEDRVEKKTSDFEREAMSASRKCTEYKNKSEKLYEQILTTSSSFNSYKNDLEKHEQEISKQVLNSTQNSDFIHQIASNLENRIKEVDEQIMFINSFINNKDTHIKHLANLENLSERADETKDKIDNFYKSFLSRKKEIDDLYLEIIGTTDDDSEDNGLKKRLENTYKELNNSFISLKISFDNLGADARKEYDSLKNDNQKKYQVFFAEMKSEYTHLYTRIKDLLPTALTAGLSSAYSDKKKDELQTTWRLTITFTIAISGLVIVSLIPFAVSLYSLQHDVKFEDVIYRLPRLAAAILPLYIPFLWIAYSSNKRRNLSKRLIEEYTHKEVLSKTYEGLSQQIKEIETKDKDIADDLKIKLLYNILEVNSENPGKLISDYNKADHPLMDALDKSVKLANAIDKLAKIPGMSKLTNVIQKKYEKGLEDQESKVTNGLENIVN